MKNNITKNTFIVCLYWLASLLVVGNIAYAQTEFEVSVPVEILMADPELDATSETSVLFAQAKRYHDGDNGEQDLLKARELYLQAAQMGSDDAKVNLGYLYFMGEGVGQDYDEARNWYLSAAKNGSRDAQLNLAMIYQNGFGVFKDNTKAKYWRTYGQVKSASKTPKIKPVTSAPEKVADLKQPENLKPEVSPAKVSQTATRVDKSVLITKPKTIIEQINENRKKTEGNPAVIKEPIIMIAQATQSIPKSQMPTPQTEEEKLGMRTVDAASHEELAGSVPQEKVLTTQAKNGLSGITDTIAAINKEASLPAPIRTLRSRQKINDREPLILSQWISNLIVVVMLSLVIFTSIWFFIQYSKIGKQKKAQVFARAFYAHHRDRLRINYLHYPKGHRKVDAIDDSWASVLCVLMVKFAQSQKGEDTLVGLQSRKIIQALKESPFKAKEAVFPFVKSTQHRIFDDIEAHECNFKGKIENGDEIEILGIIEPEDEQSTEVKLQSVSSEEQTSLLKENDTTEITE